MRYTKLRKITLCLAMVIVVTGCYVMPSQAANESKNTETADTNEDLDTHVDDGVSGKFDQDDFDTKEEYQDYLEKHPEEQIKTRAAKAMEKPNVHADAKLRYVINGLKSTAAIQKTYIGSTYIYVIQRSGTNSFLSRCTIKGSTATYKDRMLLQNFGHGQTLEWFEHKGKPYFWVTCKANTVYKTKYWGTQIGRLEYKANQTIDYTSITRFSHLSYANKSGKSFGSVKRVDAALSSDKSKLLFWVKDTDNEIQYSYYNAAKLNAALDKKVSASSKYIPCTDNVVKSACYGSFRQSGSSRALPHGSCQGVEFSDATSIYVAGGAKGDTPQIAKMTGSGSTYKYSYLAEANHKSFNKTKTETEGLQLKGNDIYFGISDDSKADSGYIFSIPKGAFKK